MIASSVGYNVALGAAVNTLLRTRSSQEYKVALQTATKLAIGYENVQLYERKDYGTSKNLTGKPLWLPLELVGEPGGIESLLLESAVSELSRQKNIITTVIQGRDTSVDEFINNGDWQIQISGILCANEARYPLEEVLKFEAFMDLNRSIKINHEVLNALGIFEIVVLSHSFPRTPHINLQAYNIQAKSTKPLPLIIQDKPNEEII